MINWLNVLLCILIDCIILNILRNNFIINLCLSKISFIFKFKIRIINFYIVNYGLFVFGIL